MCYITAQLLLPTQPITSARSLDYIYEDSGRCVAGEEEGGSVCAPPLILMLHLLHSAHHIDSIYNDSGHLEWVGWVGGAGR